VQQADAPGQIGEPEADQTAPGSCKRIGIDRAFDREPDPIRCGAAGERGAAIVRASRDDILRDGVVTGVRADAVGDLDDGGSRKLQDAAARLEVLRQRPQFDQSDGSRNVRHLHFRDRARRDG
jgi:hypothetical protein